MEAILEGGNLLISEEALEDDKAHFYISLGYCAEPSRRSLSLKSVIRKVGILDSEGMIQTNDIRSNINLKHSNSAINYKSKKFVVLLIGM
jgi:hypothetical protein